MVDRLHELKQQEAAPLHTDNQLATEISPITEKLAQLANLNRQLEQYHGQFLSDSDKKTQQKIERTVEEINFLASQTNNQIKEFREETKRQASRGANEAMLRARENQFANLSKKLMSVTKGTWEMQNHHKGDVTNQVSRRLRIRYSNPDGSQGMSEDDAQRLATKLVETGNQDQIFLLAREELERAMETRNAVLEMEKSLRELHQMFQDLNVLIAEQGEGMTEVQVAVQQAQTNVETGNKDLRTARKVQGKCCIIA